MGNNKTEVKNNTSEKRHFDIGKFLKDYFPYALTIGMTYQQYWIDEPELLKYYKKAYEIKKEAEDSKIWLQGLYFYHAILRSSPALNPYSSGKVIPYFEKPLGYETKEDKLEKERLDYERNKAMAEAWVLEFKRNEV